MFFRKQETNWLIEKKEEVKEQTPKGVRKTSNQASGENKPQNYVRPPFIILIIARVGREIYKEERIVGRGMNLVMGWGTIMGQAKRFKRGFWGYCGGYAEFGDV